MRLLFVSPRPGAEPASAPWRNLVAALAEEGHDVTLIAPAPTDVPGAKTIHPRLAPSRPIALESELTLLALRERWRRRPEIAHVIVHPGTLGVPTALAASGTSVVLEVDRPLFDEHPDPRDPSVHLRREALRAAARSARAFVARRPDLAVQVETHTGIRGVRVLFEAARGLDLDAMAPSPAGAAKRALGLLEAQRFFTLAAPLDDDLALEPLMFAHRRVPGAGLLVAGRGPGEAAVTAMSVATRPSSPVVLLEDGPEPRRLAIAASDVGLSLRRGAPGGETWAYAAMGRRQVAFDHPDLDRIDGWFPGETAVIRCPEPSADALRRSMIAALDEARTRGPLSGPGIETARTALAADARPLTAQIREVYVACGATDGN